MGDAQIRDQLAWVQRPADEAMRLRRGRSCWIRDWYRFS